MNMNGAIDEIELPVNEDEVYVHNTWTDSIPIVIHGNGPSKVKTKVYINSFNDVCVVEKSELFE